MPTRDLNKFLKSKGLSREKIKAVKQQRRTLKNRSYASSCRQQDNTIMRHFNLPPDIYMDFLSTRGFTEEQQHQLRDIRRRGKNKPVGSFESYEHVPPPRLRLRLRLRKEQKRQELAQLLQQLRHLNIWTFEHWNTGSFEYLKFWTFEHLTFRNLNIWKFEHLNISTLEHLNIWTFEHLNIWTFEHLNIWTFKHLNICTSNIWIIEQWNIGTLEHWTFDIQSASISILWHQLHLYCLSDLEWHL